ncbi:hypothetical protein [Algihabitans albus]|uniref:hypothetical protein n=1 Tax=Algihabitans albus TaxID=2164067 RepID=UPI000E5D4638|nr:hypothetical protein [Algihabitans albus]
MTDLDEANRRLEAALARLDKAISARLQGGDGSDSVGIEAAEALAEAQQESDRLRQLSGDVSRRLDLAIERLDSVLEG